MTRKRHHTEVAAIEQRHANSGSLETVSSQHAGWHTPRPPCAAARVHRRAYVYAYRAHARYIHCAAAYRIHTLHCHLLKGRLPRIDFYAYSIQFMTSKCVLSVQWRHWGRPLTVQAIQRARYRPFSVRLSAKPVAGPRRSRPGVKVWVLRFGSSTQKPGSYRCGRGLSAEGALVVMSWSSRPGPARARPC